MKIISLLLVFCMLFISGCKPTETENEVGAVNFERKPVRMARIKDALYYDTGGEWDSTAGRCGTMDTSLEKDVGEYEIPIRNGTANFDGADGAQLSGNDKYTIPIEDEGWMEFRKVDTDADINKYKYCYYIKGEIIAGEEEKEFVVLTNKQDFSFDDARNQLFTYEDYKTQEHILIPIKYGQVYDWGLDVSAENVTESGLTMVFNQSGGDVTGDLQTGGEFDIDVFKDERWQSVPKKEGTYNMWNLVAYMINKDGETKINVDWTWCCGELSPGKYRIGMNVRDFREPGDADIWTYYAEFEIE